MPNLNLRNDFIKFCDLNDLNKNSFNAIHPIWELEMAFILTYIRKNSKRFKSVRISTDLLNHLFSKKSSIPLKFLRETGLIYVVKGYSKQARRCNGYALSDKLKNAKWESFKVSNELRNTRNYKSYCEKLFNGLIIKEDQVIAELANSDKFDHKVKRKLRNDNTKLKERLSEPHKNVRMDSSSRVHSVFANMPKRYRSRMEYDGEKLVEIDVRSCQPLLMASLYGKNKKTKSGKTLYFEKVSLTPEEVEEKNRFVRLCQSSLGFYRTLSVSKSSFGYALFGNLEGNKWYANYLVKQLLKFNFPILVKRLKDLRESLVCKKKGETSFARVAVYFQRWESYLMIDNSLTKMEFGAIPIHDAVLVPKKYARIAMDIIASNFGKFLGIEKISFGTKNLFSKSKRCYLQPDYQSLCEWNNKVKICQE